MNYQADALSPEPDLNPPAVASEQFEILIGSLTINNWHAIANQFPGVLAIDVILIDLKARETKSKI